VKVSLVENLVVENVGADVMVMVPGADQVVSLSGESARVVRALLESGAADLQSSDVLDELIRCGVVHPELEAAGLSRRGLLIGGAGIAGAGVLALSMPTAAMASSAEPFGDDPDPRYFASADSVTDETGLSYSFVINSGVTPSQVRPGDTFTFVRDGVNANPQLLFASPLVSGESDGYNFDEEEGAFEFFGTQVDFVFYGENLPEFITGLLVRGDGKKFRVSFRLSLGV
jgi:hypothetical protein